MKSTARNLILAGLATLVAAPAAAGGYPGLTGNVVGLVAELSPEQRAWFREQLNPLPPEARDALRHKLREDWRELPPEERQKKRSELIERMHDKPGERDRKTGGDRPETGYGQGYETRQWEYPDMPGGRGRR